MRSDHLSNPRRGGACIYDKYSLAWKISDIRYCLLDIIVFQESIANWLCNFISSYESPSQPTDVFDQFPDNIELTLDELTNQNPFAIVVLGDFNENQGTGTNTTKRHTRN